MAKHLKKCNKKTPTVGLKDKKMFKCNTYDKAFEANTGLSSHKIHETKTKKSLSHHINIPTHDSFQCQFCEKLLNTNREICLHRQICFGGIKFKNESGENKCYINASVNALASLSRLTDTIVNSNKENDPIIDIFKRVILTNGIHDIKQLKTLVGRGKYSGTRQQDACEFLEDLLTKLNEIFPDLKSLFSMITVTTRGCQLGHKKETTYGSAETVLRIPLTDTTNNPIIRPNANIQSLIDGYYQQNIIKGAKCDDCPSNMVEEKYVQQHPIFF